MVEADQISSESQASGGFSWQILALLLGGLGPPLLFTVPAPTPTLASIAQEFGGGTYGSTLAQLIMTMPALGIVLGGTVSSPMIRMLGPRLGLITMSVAFGFMALAPLVVDHPVALLVTRFLAGIAASGAAVATTVLLTLLFDEKRRTRLVSFLAAFGAAGGLVTLLLSGWLSSNLGWRASFCLYFVGFIVAGVVWATIPAVKVPVASESKGDWGLLRTLWLDYLVVILVFSIIFMAGTQTSFLLAQRGIVDPSVQSLVLGCSAVANILGGLCYPTLVRFLGRQRAFAFLLLSLGAGAILMGAWPLLAASFVGCTLLGFGGGLSNPHFINNIISRAGAQASAAIGFCYSSIFIGEFISPMMVLPLRLEFGLGAAFTIIGIAVSLIAVTVAARRTRVHASSKDISNAA